MNADAPAGTVWHITMSLGGNIAGPDDTMDWAHGSGHPVAATDRSALPGRAMNASGPAERHADLDEMARR